VITYKQLCEKLFDGTFGRRNEQDEALEVLQDLGKLVDSRKVKENRITLRNGIFVLVKRPMTAVNTGYLIVQIVDDNDSGRIQNNSVNGKIIKNYGGNDFKVGSSIELGVVDTMAISQDNKRYYVVYPSSYQPPPSIDDDDVADKIDDVGDDLKDVEKSLKGLEKNVDKKKSVDDKTAAFLSKIKSMESAFTEKYLSNGDIEEMIDSIKKRLEGRSDSDARGMLKLVVDIEKTFQEKGRLHPNSVIALQRISSGVGGSWGKNSPDWDGKPPSGRVVSYPPPPSQYS
jgi:hypothetical protein